MIRARKVHCACMYIDTPTNTCTQAHNKCRPRKDIDSK